MRVQVYEVVRFFEVDVEGEGPIAMRDAIARVERGEVRPSRLRCRHIAFPATSRLPATDPREVWNALIHADVATAVAAAKHAGVYSQDDPDPQSDWAGWLAAIVHRAVSAGRLAWLASGLAR